MTKVRSAADLAPYIGQELGVSRWVELSPAKVAEFGALTGDQHWIHTDPDRVRRQTPYAAPLVHGFFILALLTDLGSECMDIAEATQWLNVGLDRLRFTSPVVVGSRVRLRESLQKLDLDTPGRARITVGCTIEVDGATKPALVSDRIMLAMW